MELLDHLEGFRESDVGFLLSSTWLSSAGQGAAGPPGGFGESDFRALIAQHLAALCRPRSCWTTWRACSAMSRWRWWRARHFRFVM